MVLVMYGNKVRKVDFVKGSRCRETYCSDRDKASGKSNNPHGLDEPGDELNDDKTKDNEARDDEIDESANGVDRDMTAKANKTDDEDGWKPSAEKVRERFIREVVRGVLYDIYRGVRTTSIYRGKAVREEGLVYLEEQAFLDLKAKIRGDIEVLEKDKEERRKSALKGMRRMVEEGRLEELVEVIRFTAYKENIRTFFGKEKYRHKKMEDEQAELEKYRLHNILPVYNFIADRLPDLKDKILAAYQSNSQGRAA